MKNAIFSFAVLFVSTVGAQAQQPTYVMNGKTYFVYPYQQEVEIQERNFEMGIKQKEVLTRDSLNRTIISTEVRPILFPIPMDNSKFFRKYKKMLLTMRTSYPALLYEYNLPLDQDIVPTLEPLADGNYVQFYRDMPYIKDEILRYRNDYVCAVFTLKNNRLNGFACWLTTDGDTIKSGNFTDGLKEGSWSHHIYNYNPKTAEIKLSGFLDGSYKDTTSIEANYKNGLLNGPYRTTQNNFVLQTGHFKDGEESGEWKHYDRKVIMSGPVPIYTEESVLIRHYFIPEKPIKGKSVIIRNAIIDPTEFYQPTHNLPNDTYFDSFSSYYSLYKEKKEEGLELPEENTNSYPGEVDMEKEYYGERDYYGEFSDYQSLDYIDFTYVNYDHKVYIKGKEYSRNDLIDSVGYEFPFEGIYEEFHRNGQLKIRFEIRDGNLVSEDTMFWSNGNPVSVVSFDPLTKEYSEKTYDFDNKLIKEIIYDEKGNFVRKAGTELDAYKRLINNRIYTTDNYYDRLYRYDKTDTLKYNLVNPVVVEEQLWLFNEKPASTTTFDPVTHVYNKQDYSIDNQLVRELNVQFGDKYENVNGTERYHVGKLESYTQINGSYYVNPLYNSLMDTVLNKRVMYWPQMYDLQYDNILKYDGLPFSGKFTLNSHEKNFGLKMSRDRITFNYSESEKHRDAANKTYNKYVKKGKAGKLAPYYTAESIYNLISPGIFYNMFSFTTNIFTPVNPTHFMKYGYMNDRDETKLISERQAKIFDKTLEGQFLNGKPEGLWLTKDQHGNTTAKVNFVNGELDGEALFYKTAYPKTEETMNYYNEYSEYYSEVYRETNPLLRDSLPAKPTYYLSLVSHYKNGILNGPFVITNWMGDTISSMTYIDGLRSGTVFERSKIAFSVSEYESGVLDGISQTYLTIPGKDTILLYDLNFQNGLLQGESKSYHLNGNIAKHGFFLMGEPIDDFEAFDTLGFRYQYVKFQFSQPVEEKIWEENQLSVRYTFDWRDSIYFNTSDIAGSTSLELMLSDLGLGGDAYNMPYYGRPSLVDKSGINYHMTKYYPNDTIARDGDIKSGKKVGCWQFYSYEGKKLYEVDYFDTIITVNDSVRFKSKGVLTYPDGQGQPASHSYIVEKFEKYDCAHTDHYEVRMLVTFWEKDSSVHHVNGYVKNYYDNGVLQNEGWVKNGVATGVWKFYDPYGSLNQVGEYATGKRQGRWLSGDLSQIKYMGDICLNPNLQNLDEILSYEEKLLDISVVYYQMGVVKKREYYGVNMNPEGPPQHYMGEDDYYYPE